MKWEERTVVTARDQTSNPNLKKYIYPQFSSHSNNKSKIKSSNSPTSKKRSKPSPSTITFSKKEKSNSKWPPKSTNLKSSSENDMPLSSNKSTISSPVLTITPMPTFKPTQSWLNKKMVSSIITTKKNSLKSTGSKPSSQAMSSDKKSDKLMSP